MSLGGFKWSTQQRANFGLYRPVVEVYESTKGAVERPPG